MIMNKSVHFTVERLIGFFALRATSKTDPIKFSEAVFSAKVISLLINFQVISENLDYQTTYSTGNFAQLG